MGNQSNDDQLHIEDVSTSLFRRGWGLLLIITQKREMGSNCSLGKDRVNGNEFPP